MRAEIRSVLVVLAVAGCAAAPVLVSAHRLANASTAAATAAIAYDAALHEAQEIFDLRASQETVQLQKRPAQDLIAQVNAILADAGIPASRFKSLTPESESSVAPSSGDSAEPRLKQQSLRLALENLSLPEIGTFLNRWHGSGNQQIWTTTRLELSHIHDQVSPNYDVTIIVTALYLAES